MIMDVFYREQSWIWLFGDLMVKMTSQKFYRGSQIRVRHLVMRSGTLEYDSYCMSHSMTSEISWIFDLKFINYNLNLSRFNFEDFWIFHKPGGHPNYKNSKTNEIQPIYVPESCNKSQTLICYPYKKHTNNFNILVRNPPPGFGQYQPDTPANGPHLPSNLLDFDWSSRDCSSYALILKKVWRHYWYFEWRHNAVHITRHKHSHPSICLFITPTDKL